MRPTPEQFRKVIFEGAKDPEVEKYFNTTMPPKDVFDLGDASTYKIEKYIKYYNDVKKYRPYSDLAGEIDDTIYALHHFYNLEKYALSKKTTADGNFGLKTKVNRLCEAIDIISESISNLSDALDLMSPWNETKEIDNTIGKIKMDAKAGIVSSTSILSTAYELLRKTQALYESVKKDVMS